MIIPIECIHPNTLNPRKDLGDLSELTSSIKKNGIFQNLVVLENEASGRNYTLIMGHRRYAAAVKAGLKELPCNVVHNISEADQVTMMLSENMQRNNLTKFEESAGIQQALDLGLSESEVAEKTGFTKQTITKHKKAMEVGAEVVKKGYEEGATIDQLIELAKIKDEKTREKLSDSLGSCSFDYELQAALNKQAWEPTKQKIIEALEDKFQAKPCKKRWGEGKTIEAVKDIKVPKKITDKYFYYAGDVGSVDLYRGEEKKDSYTSNSSSKKEKQKEREQRSKECEDAYKIAYACRLKFVKDYLKKNNKVDNELLKLFISSVATDDIAGTYSDTFKDTTGREDESAYFEKEKSCQNMLVATAYASLDNEENNIFSNYSGYYYEDDNNAKLLYKILKMIGYVPSEVEESMLDGSWELFEK